MAAQLRPAVPGDAAAIATIHVKAWRHAYAGLLPDYVLDELDAARWGAQRADRLRADGGPWSAEDHVAELDGEIVGFTTVGRCRDADAGPDDGEVFAIYVDPDRWGSGIGRALIALAERRLRERGARRVVLWVLAGNDRARRFYERAGYSTDGGTKPWVGERGESVPEIRYVKELGGR